MNITNLPAQSVDVIDCEPWVAIRNAIDYGWALPGEDVVSFADLIAAKNEVLDALMNADTPNLDKVLAVMAAHDPNMMNTEL